MKKLIAIALAALMLCALTACNETGNPGSTPNTPAEGFTFTYQGLDLVPGAEFDAAALSQVESFENPNCAGEGKFITYLHDAIELTVNELGGKTVIYSIYLTDANTPTAEGLHLGDYVASATELYGTGVTSDDGGTITFTKGATQLIVVVDDGMVSSIEYRRA